MKFKTNLKCTGCISTLKPNFDAEKGIASWEVDLKSPKSILTVHSENLSEKVIEKIVARAGFSASSFE